MTDPARDAQVLRERDLYHSLLELGTREELEPFVAEALALIVSVTGAQRGYLELFEQHEDPGDRGYWAVHGCSEHETPAFRAGISGSVITEALARRATISSASAIVDPRFRDSKSVKDNQITAVLCAPVVVGRHLGVLYLQGRAPVLGRVPVGPFGEDARRHAETFARHIGAFTDRLLMRRRARDNDPTRPFRRQLVAADQLVGASPAIARVLRDAALAAPLDVGVLIVGATGTGKSMLARIVHQSGPRSGGPFVELNCAALPEALLESELFGAVQGAHSTATRKLDGKVAAAAGGTLFLDEIGELSLGAQAKLLQLLQNKEYFPLGGTHKFKADVRILAATNANLRAAAAARTFREDLLYRLEVMTIRMPALEEREDDIPELVRHACARACETHGFPLLRISPAALYAVQTAEWPGNVRQLQHAVETAVIRANGEGVAQVEPRHLFPDSPEQADAPQSYQEASRRFQRQYVRHVLDEVGWNVSEAARRLDLGRTYLHRLISSFGLTRGERQP